VEYGEGISSRLRLWLAIVFVVEVCGHQFRSSNETYPPTFQVKDMPLRGSDALSRLKGETGFLRGTHASTHQASGAGCCGLSLSGRLRVIGSASRRVSGKAGGSGRIGRAKLTLDIVQESFDTISGLMSVVEALQQVAPRVLTTCELRDGEGASVMSMRRCRARCFLDREDRRTVSSGQDGEDRGHRECRRELHRDGDTGTGCLIEKSWSGARSL